MNLAGADGSAHQARVSECKTTSQADLETIVLIIVRRNNGDGGNSSSNNNNNNNKCSAAPPEDAAAAAVAAVADRIQWRWWPLASIMTPSVSSGRIRARSPGASQMTTASKALIIRVVSIYAAGECSPAESGLQIVQSIRQAAPSTQR
jgi:hypothetical protein